MTDSRSGAAAPAGAGGTVAAAAVAAAYVAAQLLSGAAGVPLDLDEAVYASQFASDVATIPFAAHRAPGQGLLAAPAAFLTSSVVALRVYFAVLSGVLLFLAYRPWRRVLGGNGAALAAGLFALSWVALRFGATVLPNVPVALGAVGAAGVLAGGGRRRAWPALLVIFAGLGLLRPTDAVAIALPLLAAAALVPAWRRPAAPLGILAGLGIAGTAWLVESYARFGDPAARLAAIGAVNGSGGVHFSVLRHLQALHGRESCLPSAAGCGPVTAAAALWWCGGLALAAAGLYAARGARPALATCAATALVFGGSYVFLSDWAVPRYLLPVYALLSVPAAAGLTAIVRAGAAGRRGGRAASALAASALAAAVLAGTLVHAGLQAAAAHRNARKAHRALSWPVAAATALERRGVGGGAARPASGARGGEAGGCAVLGRFAPQIAFLRRCRAADMHDGIGPRDSSGDPTAANIARLRARGLRVAVVTARRPAGAAGWEAIRVRGGGRLRVYLSPAR